MQRKAFVAIATVVLLGPGLALAAGCGMDKTPTTASNCPALMTWDQTSGKCVLTPSS